MSLENVLGEDVNIAKELSEAPAEQAAPEPEKQEVKEQKEEVKETKEPEKMVPYGALHEARMKEREYRDQLKKVEQEAAERFSKLEQRLQSLAAPPKEIPKFEVSPLENLKAVNEESQTELKEVRKQLESFNQQGEMARQEQLVRQHTQLAEAEFSKTAPDYIDAVGHLQRVVDSNLQVMGIESPAERAQIIQQQALGLAQQALKAGKSPAELVYQMAKNYGYQAKKTEVKEETKIEQIKKGQESSQSLGSGGKADVPLTLKSLEAMDDEDFAALVEDDKRWKKLIQQM